MKHYLMGAIVGDIIGSRFEWSNPEEFNKPRLVTKQSRFTDDTILTVAIAHSLTLGIDYERSIKCYTKKYPNAGYGKMFKTWALSKEPLPAYNSYGNGAAMRLLAIPLYFNTLPEVLKEVVKQASYTHNHTDSLESVMLLAHTIFLARTVKDKKLILDEINKVYGYKYCIPGDPIVRKESLHSLTGVNEALNCFFHNKSYVSTIIDSIKYGGDTDTIAAMSGGLAYVFYEKMPQKLFNDCKNKLNGGLKDIILEFSKKTEKK